MSKGYRNGWKKGEFLIIDSESGMTRFSGQVKRDYTGERVTKRYADYEQPQDFVRPTTDPRPIPFSNPSLQSFNIFDFVPYYVGETTVLTESAPANHIFTSANRYRVGIGGVWNSNSNWGYGSGAIADAPTPTSSTNVFIDSNASGTLTVSSTANAQSLDFSGFSGTFAGGSSLSLFGSLTMSTSMTRTFSGTITFSATTTGNLITSNNVSFQNDITFSGVGGGWSLGNDLTDNANNTVQLIKGSFSDNGHNLNLGFFNSSGFTGDFTRSLTMSGTWTFNQTSGTSPITFFNVGSTGAVNLTVSATGSLIKYIYPSAVGSFFGGGKTYYNLYLNCNGGEMRIRDSNTFNNIKVDPNNALKFTAGTTTTLTGSTPLTATGTAGNLITIGGVTAANYSIISANNITTDYITISHCQFSGGGTWHAGANSVDGGNNSGITFP